MLWAFAEFEKLTHTFRLTHEIIARDFMGARRRVEICAPIRQDLAQAEEHARALLRVAREVGSGEAPLVQRDQLVPAPGDERLLFERGEGAGVPPSMMAAMQETVTIPMQPPVESLNVAIAAAPGLNRKAPTRARNSPTKPDNPGKPAEAKTKNPNVAA